MYWLLFHLDSYCEILVMHSVHCKASMSVCMLHAIVLGSSKDDCDNIRDRK